MGHPEIVWGLSGFPTEKSILRFGAGCGDFDFAAGPDTLGLTHWMLEGIQSSPQRNSAAVANETSFADRAPLFSR
jgi:hypothetical protein